MLPSRTGSLARRHQKPKKSDRLQKEPGVNMQIKMTLSCVQAQGQRPLLTAPAETALDLQHVPTSMYADCCGIVYHCAMHMICRFGTTCQTSIMPCSSHPSSSTAVQLSAEVCSPHLYLLMLIVNLGTCNTLEIELSYLGWFLFLLPHFSPCMISLNMM